MKDKISANAVDAAIKFGNEEIKIEELNAAYSAYSSAKRKSLSNLADIFRIHISIDKFNYNKPKTK